MKQAVASRSLDNITVVIIAFKNFRKTLKAEIDKFQDELRRQRSEAHGEGTDICVSSEDQHAAEQIDNKRVPQHERGKESGIVISKTLNLPNYDLSLQDVEIQPTLVGLARLQKLTTGSHTSFNGRGSPNARLNLFPFSQHANVTPNFSGNSSFASNIADGSSVGEDDGNASSSFSLQKKADLSAH